MASEKLKINSRPNLKGGRLLLAFSGWMDGGDVSTGTVNRLVEDLNAVPVAEIDPEQFYIYNFPGDMETVALFRPHIHIEDGLVKKVEMPSSVFYASEARNLALFVGREPDLNWTLFGSCVFDFAVEMGIESIFFVGSFAGAVPHTREPRLHVSVSDPRLKTELQKYGLRPTNYEGPGSFMTYLTSQAPKRGVEMANIVAEIPAYIKGTNPLSIEAVTRHVAAILGLEVDLSALRGRSNDWQQRVNDVVKEDPEMATQVRELEKQYDDDLVDAGVDVGLLGIDLLDNDPTRGTDDDAT